MGDAMSAEASPFDRMRTIADAVLLEGYLLYPYRSTAPKNQFRWAFGVVAPQAFSVGGGDEPWWMQAQLPLEGEGAAVEGRVRFLRLQRRDVEASDAGTFRAVDRLEAGGDLHLSWDEAVVEEIAFAIEPGDDRRRVDFSLAGWQSTEALGDAGRIVRRRWPIEGTLHLRSVPLGAGLRRVEIRVENHTPCPPGAGRDEALRFSLLSTHVLLAARGGAFVSLLDPPPFATDAAARCENVRAFPVLAGPPGDRHLALASPIILYDHPQIAPESPGDFFDATEIDELLSLRTALLTDEEKRLARATDPRAAAIVDRVDALGATAWERMHGATRDLSRAEMVPRTAIGTGDRVRLRAPSRRTDAQDLLYAGMLATVEKVFDDVDGTRFLAVTIDGDPGADLHRWYGRFHYYRPDEVELVERARAEAAP